jgi:uridylate kinase
MTNYKRVILKLSGELFQSTDNNIDFERYEMVARQLNDIHKNTNVELAIVVGGGNIFRGRQANSSVDSNEADSMGMMATIINGIGLREAFLRAGAQTTRLMTSVNIPQIAEPYIRQKARHHLSNGRIVIIAGGLGMPHFTTDSAVAQYANELNCEIILKASTTDGVYDSDPRSNPSAQKYDSLSYKQALEQNLAVMDRTAFAMCERSKIPIFVFNIASLETLDRIVKGDFSFGSIIR